MSSATWTYCGFPRLTVPVEIIATLDVVGALGTTHPGRTTRVRLLADTLMGDKAGKVLDVCNGQLDIARR